MQQRLRTATLDARSIVVFKIITAVVVVVVVVVIVTFAFVAIAIAIAIAVAIAIGVAVAVAVSIVVTVTVTVTFGIAITVTIAIAVAVALDVAAAVDVAVAIAVAVAIHRRRCHPNDCQLDMLLSKVSHTVGVVVHPREPGFNIAVLVGQRAWGKVMAEVIYGGIDASQREPRSNTVSVMQYSALL
jgi:hypothetical protein